MSRQYAARRNKDGSYRVTWGQQTEIPALDRETARAFAEIRNRTIDGRGFCTLADDAVPDNAGLLALIGRAAETLKKER